MSSGVQLMSFTLIGASDQANHPPAVWPLALQYDTPPKPGARPFRHGDRTHPMAVSLAAAQAGLLVEAAFSIPPSAAGMSVRTSTDSLLGSLPEQVITHAGTQTLTWTIPGTQVGKEGVCGANIQWVWEHKLPGGEWRQLRRTEFPLFVTLEHPANPWGWTSTRGAQFLGHIHGDRVRLGQGCQAAG